MPLPCEGAEITVARLDRGVRMSHPARLHDPGAMHHAMPGTPARIEPRFWAAGGAFPPWAIFSRGGRIVLAKCPVVVLSAARLYIFPGAWAILVDHDRWRRRRLGAVSDRASIRSVCGRCRRSDSAGEQNRSKRSKPKSRFVAIFPSGFLLRPIDAYRFLRLSLRRSRADER